MNEWFLHDCLLWGVLWYYSIPPNYDYVPLPNTLDGSSAAAQKVVDNCEKKMKHGFDSMVQEIKKCMDTFGTDQEAKNMENIKKSELSMAARLSAVETKLRGELIPSSVPNNDRPMAMLELGNPFDTSAARSHPASSPEADNSLLPDISLLDTGFAQS